MCARDKSVKVVINDQYMNNMFIMRFVESSLRTELTLDFICLATLPPAGHEASCHKHILPQIKLMHRKNNNKSEVGEEKFVVYSLQAQTDLIIRSDNHLFNKCRLFY